MRLVTQSGHSNERRLILLAPACERNVTGFAETVDNGDLHGELLGRVQRLRGAVYLEDGAIQASDLTEDGRHIVSMDAESWHILLADGEGSIQGCARYWAHPSGVGFQDLNVRTCPLAHQDEWKMAFRDAVESEMGAAQSAGLAYVEVGGWALHPRIRHSTEALRIALASYALASILGGCLGISTVTLRHSSASILRKLGGRSLAFAGTEVPGYYDPNYGCMMEVLRFDSRVVNRRFAECVGHLRQQLVKTSVVRAGVSYRRLCREVGVNVSESVELAPA